MAGKQEGWGGLPSAAAGLELGLGPPAQARGGQLPADTQRLLPAGSGGRPPQAWFWAISPSLEASRARQRAQPVVGSSSGEPKRKGCWRGADPEAAMS